MDIHDGHRARLRARFLSEGLAGFEQHTALELLLFYARPRCDTNRLAHRLISRFGSFSGVLDAPLEELAQVSGVGESTAAFLKLVPACSAYYLACLAKPGEVLDSSQKAGAFFIPRFLGKGSEEVWLAALNDRRKVTRCVCVSSGGIVNAAAIAVKRVVTEAVNSGATGVLLAHNHPGGVALPSLGDKEMTNTIRQALSIIGVQLVDHIIVAGDDFISMADSGFL